MEIDPSRSWIAFQRVVGPLGIGETNPVVDDSVPIFHFVRTDVGMKRSHNQDALRVVQAPNAEAWRKRGHVYVVADGMGAHAVGELASKLAVDTIQHSYMKLAHLEPSEALREAILEANRVVHEKGKQNPEFKGMGTTATALILAPQGATVGHVGDSRCYRIRGNTIEQLSFDHSLLWETARRKKCAPERLSVPSNVIMRSLGPKESVKPDVAGPYSVELGDRFLLCSDGLSGPVRDRELWSVVSHLPGEEAVEFLVDLANLRGGPDNITVILIQIGEMGQAQPCLATKKISLGKRLAQIPWGAVTIIFGLGLAGLAYLLQEIDGTALPVAILAVLAMALGLILEVGRRRKREAAAGQSEPKPPPTYRPQTVHLEKTLVQNLAKAENQIRELAVESQWKLDWEELNLIKAEAKAELEAGHLAEAFRQFCRVLSRYSAAMKKHQGKTEVLVPHW